jgi:hypothetical protein
VLENVARCRRVWRKLDKSDLVAEERLRRGWPRALPLLLLFVLPTFLAGPIRSVTGIDLNLALVLGIVITVGAAWPFWRALIRKPEDRRRAAVANAVPLALAILSAVLLYNRDFAGLYGYQDSGGNVAIDAAVHTLTAYQFQTSNPWEYQGFVSLYSFWFAISHFVDFITAANLSFQLTAATVAVAPCVVAFAVLRRFEGIAFYAGAAACLAAGLLLGWSLVLPLEAFHFAGGFWAHLFALIPLCAIWWADALIRPPLLRIGAVLLLTALYRYTYGLNLADLLGAVGALLALEAAGTRLTRVGQIAAGALALAAFAGAQHAFSRLAPLVTNSTGWIVPHDMAAVWRGQLLGVGALAAGALFQRGLCRALRFPALFALASAVSVELFKAQPNGERAWGTMWANYYFNKYSVHAILLLAAGLVVAAAWFAAALTKKPAWRTVAVAAVTLLLGAAGVDKLYGGFAPYHDVRDEVAFGQAPYPHLRPWVDTEGLRLIHSTLLSERKEHGGYLASYYPLAAFMNATLGHGKAPFWERQPVEATDGHCVFVAAEGDTSQFQSCSSYEAKWEGRERRLCWRCF